MPFTKHPHPVLCTYTVAFTWFSLMGVTILSQDVTSFGLEDLYPVNPGKHGGSNGVCLGGPGAPYRINLIARLAKL